MTDATILIPTFRHASLLPYAVRSALDQRGASIELFLVGDGVEDASRAALEPFGSDSRVHFFDFPKGDRNGELHRHTALQHATGQIVCYLSDDDLLLPDHVAEMHRLLQHADFAHPPSARFISAGDLTFFPWNYARAEFVQMARGRLGSIGLTGTAHTLAAYLRLPHGWRPAPPRIATDHYMWLQFLDLPGLRRAMSDRLTYLCFPEPAWGGLPEDDRAATLATWLARSREEHFSEELDMMLRVATRRAAEDYHIWARTEELGMETVQRTRTWRLRERFLKVDPRRTLFARRDPP